MEFGHLEDRKENGRMKVDGGARIRVELCQDSKIQHEWLCARQMYLGVCNWRDVIGCLQLERCNWVSDTKFVLRRLLLQVCI